jgi:hypothetical protein
VLSSVLFFPPAESRLFSFLFFFFPAVLLDEFDLEKEPNRQKRESRKEGRTESGTGVGSGGLTFRLPFRIAPRCFRLRAELLPFPPPARCFALLARSFFLFFSFVCSCIAGLLLISNENQVQDFEDA